MLSRLVCLIMSKQIEMENRSGLRLILNYDRIFCNTYFGWNFDQKLSKLKRFSLIVWNLLFLSLSAFHCYNTLENVFWPSKSKLISESTHANLAKGSVIPFLLISIGYVIFSIQSLIVGLFLLIRGPAIMDFLNENDIIRVSPSFEKKVALIINIIRFLFVFSNILLSTVFGLDDFHPNNTVLVIKFTLFTIIYFLTGNANLNILVFTLYKSLIISNQLKKISKFKDLKIIVEIIGKIQASIQRFDSLISFNNMTMLTTWSLICIANVCMLAINHHEHQASVIGHLIGSILIISSLCIICDIIPKSFNKLLTELKNRSEEFNENKLDFEQLFNQIRINRLNEMKDEMCFTAFNLFKLNANTLLSCLALIISYSIIIIQTNDSSQPKSVSNCTSQ